MNLSNLPRISAHRGDTDEAWRLERLRIMLSLAARRANPEERVLLRRAVLRVHDHEGDLHVLWDGKLFNERFVLLVRDAWRRLGQFVPVRHMIMYCWAASPGRRLSALTTDRS